MRQRTQRAQAGCHVQGVVNICSPVNTALAPAMKHIACLDSSSVCRPAARRMMVLGSTIRAVEIVRRMVWNPTGCAKTAADQQNANA